MSSREVRRVSRQDIQLVQNLIERCLQLYMNQQEVVQTLLDQAKIEPDFTELVWQKLEEENQEFFKAYHLRLVVKQQIMVFNKLLEQQVELMCQMQATGLSSISTSNGSHISQSALTMQQQQGSTCFTPDRIRTALKPEYLHASIGANLTNVMTNGGSAMQTIVHNTSHVRRNDTSSHMLSTQSSDLSLIQGMNGGMIKPEPGYPGNIPFMFGADGNTLETRAPMGNGSFNGVEENSQIVNDPQTLLDADPSTYGFLGQIPRNFSLSDLTADYSHSSVSDIMEYSRSPFLATDTDSFVDSTESQGNNTRLRSISEYQNFRSG